MNELEGERRQREAEARKADQLNRELSLSQSKLEAVVTNLHEKEAAHKARVEELEKALTEAQRHAQLSAEEAERYHRRDDAAEKALEFEIQQEQQH